MFTILITVALLLVPISLGEEIGKDGPPPPRCERELWACRPDLGVCPPPCEAKE